MLIVCFESIEFESLKSGFLFEPYYLYSYCRELFWAWKLCTDVYRIIVSLVISLLKKKNTAASVVAAGSPITEKNNCLKNAKFGT